MNFWTELKNKKKPFFAVAPMADVTDAAFRQLITRYGRPDVMWTEFVSANGLMSSVQNPAKDDSYYIEYGKKHFPHIPPDEFLKISYGMSQGRDVLARDLEYSEGERPIVAQLFSSDPDMMRGAAKLAASLGFDGIDINMGCPDKTIEKQGAGAAMIKSPETALVVIRAAKQGIQDAGKTIPLSVKTRVGYNDVQIDTWIPLLLSEGIAALTVHARTRKELSLVPANWDRIKEVVKLRDRIAPETVIIGNGDVTSLADGRARALEAGCDGVMVGRALFGNPWFFDASREVVAALPRKSIFRNVPILKKFFDTKRTAPTSASKPITTEERLRVMTEHCELFENLLGDIKSFAIMKKHFKAYCTGFVGAKDLRIKLMETKSAEEVKKLVSEFLLQ